MNRRGAPLAVLLGAAVVAGCEPRPPEYLPPEGALPSASDPQPALPDALLVHFKSVRGAGLSRESWEIEVLQMVGEIRVRGSVRIGGSSIPILRSMGPREYEEFWAWLSEFPLDRYRVEEDVTAPQEGWRKSCEVDVVLSPDRRLISKNQWTRPLVTGGWIGALEDRLHLMALEYAKQELTSGPTDPEGPKDLEEGVRRALEALGDAGTTSPPAASSPAGRE